MKIVYAVGDHVPSLVTVNYDLSGITPGIVETQQSAVLVRAWGRQNFGSSRDLKSYVTADATDEAYEVCAGLDDDQASERLALLERLRRERSTAAQVEIALMVGLGARVVGIGGGECGAGIVDSQAIV